jgi:2,3-dihydroxybenzoate decarboxylase
VEGSSQGKIALEEHVLNADFDATLPSFMDPERMGEVKRRLHDVDGERLAAMDRAGIEIAVLSLNSPGVQAVTDPAQAVQLAARANEDLAALVATHPDRYAGLAAVALQDPAAAVRELERCVGELGFCGALVNGYSNVGDPDTGVYLDDSTLEPFWECVQDLRVPVYLHPRDPLPSQQQQYAGHPELLGSAWGFTAETAVHALRLILSGLFDRYPSVSVVLGHLGETLPFNIWRIEHRFARLTYGKRLERPLSAYLSENFYHTTSGIFRDQSLIDTVLEVGADRVLFSADYPWESMDEAASWFDAAPISEADRVKIGRTNAQRLLGLGQD